MNPIEGYSEKFAVSKDIEITEKDAKRFYKYVEKTDSCWNWTGSKDARGYGQFGVNCGEVRRTVRSHRFSFKHHYKSMRAGFVLDHICKNTLCVNPDHLREVTPSVNNYENSNSLAGTYHKRLSCFKGHTYTDGSYKHYPSQGKNNRFCLICQKERNDKKGKKNAKTVQSSS